MARLTPAAAAATTAVTLLLLAVPARAATSITIVSYAPYLNLRECAQECIWHRGNVDDVVASGLGCQSPWVNECLCRVDLATVASSFLTSCCSSRCTLGSPDADITAAVGVYNSYCVSNGFAVTAGAAAAAAPTGGSGSSGQTGGPTTGQGTVHGQPTETASSSSTGGAAPSSTQLSTPALIGIIVSVVCSVLGLVFGVAFKVYTYKREKKRAERQRQQEQRQRERQRDQRVLQDRAMLQHQGDGSKSYSGYPGPQYEIHPAPAQYQVGYSNRY